MYKGLSANSTIYKREIYKEKLGINADDSRVVSFTPMSSSSLSETFFPFYISEFTISYVIYIKQSFDPLGHDAHEFSHNMSIL